MDESSRRPHPPPVSLETGVRLGRFELLAPIAQGGMGAVWAARALPGEDLVAIKTILPGDAKDAAVRTMFLDEARVAQLARHPNVCQVLDFGNERGTLYMVLEWVEGDSLRTVLKAAPVVPHDVALRIVRRVCEALHAAHELSGDDGHPLGLVHRDVSPHNVLVSAFGDVKLIDFGIAKTRQRISETTNSGVLKGKLRYMAPEQIEGAPVDRRADVWSLGAVLYGLASGDEIFGTMSEPDILRALVMREGIPPLPDSVPAPVAGVIARALAFDAAERFPSAAAMQRAIDEALVAIGAANDPDDRAPIARFAAQHLDEALAMRRAALDAARAALGRRARTGRGWRGRALAAAAIAAALAAAGIGIRVTGAARPAHDAPAPALVAANAASPPPGPATTPAADVPPPAPPAPDATGAPKKPTPPAGRSGKRPRRPGARPAGTGVGSEFDTHD
jgi:hypothetical protein